MGNKFSRNAYFRLVYSDRNKYAYYFETYFTPLSRDLLAWKDFYLLCSFPEKEKRKWEKIYHHYYIHFYSFIDSYDGCEIDTLKYLKVDYHVLTLLKNEFPNCYIEFIRNYQVQLLVKKYPDYLRLAKSQWLRIEDSAFNHTNSSIEIYNSLANEIKEQELKQWLWLVYKKEQTPRRSMTYEAFVAIIIAEKVYSGWLSKERGVMPC